MVIKSSIGEDNVIVIRKVQKVLDDEMVSSSGRYGGGGGFICIGGLTVFGGELRGKTGLEIFGSFH